MKKDSAILLALIIFVISLFSCKSQVEKNKLKISEKEKIASSKFEPSIKNSTRLQNNKQNPYEKYSEFIAFEYSPLIHKLLDYSDALNDKDKNEFLEEYSSIFSFLHDLKLQKMRLVFSMCAEYYGDNKYRNIKKEQKIIDDVGVFMNNEEFRVFAKVFKQILEIVIRKTNTNSNTPIEIKNIIESFEKEIILLQTIRDYKPN